MTYEDALRMTDREVWSKLSEQGKVEVLQAVEDHMAEECGREARTVESKWLYTGDDGIELGRYQTGNQTIYVNASQLGEGSLYGDNPDKMVEAVLHEGRHAFQHDVAEGRVPYEDAETAQAWAKNLEPGGYVRFDENPRAYWDQPVEADARRFASDRLSQMRSERTAIAERDAAREAAREASGEAPTQGQGAAPSGAPGEGSSHAGGGQGPSGGGESAGDGHDDARGAFDSAGDAPGEQSVVAQRHGRGLRMM